MNKLFLHVLSLTSFQPELSVISQRGKKRGSVLKGKGNLHTDREKHFRHSSDSHPNSEGGWEISHVSARDETLWAEVLSLPALSLSEPHYQGRDGMGRGRGMRMLWTLSFLSLSLRKRAAALPFHSFALLRLSPVNQPVLSAPLFSISKAAAADAHGIFGSSGAGLCAQVLSVWHFSTVIRPRPQLFFWKILNRK